MWQIVIGQLSEMPKDEPEMHLSIFHSIIRIVWNVIFQVAKNYSYQLQN